MRTFSRGTAKVLNLIRRRSPLNARWNWRWRETSSQPRPRRHRREGAMPNNPVNQSADVIPKVLLRNPTSCFGYTIRWIPREYARNDGSSHRLWVRRRHAIAQHSLRSYLIEWIVALGMTLLLSTAARAQDSTTA